ncbi:hypothetical protein HNP38_002392 [Chryseobacterium defluvii]|uniref:Uncharacterized protein n=1 Tax=Chryseobacterium defluvii TaxID=160396 RepID=A0A840KGE5_9FLAO|nr:hypothetical protein [Chryseobacterium defluvii]MBB4807088.1 hypothetical protein [Chryseobacterium defluvii]
MKFKQKLTSSLLLLLTSVTAYGQYTYDEACNILRKNGFTVYEGKYNHLQQGYSFDYTRTFQPGFLYGIVAYTGSEYVKDIGLLVWSDKDKLLFQDSKKSNYETAHIYVDEIEDVRIEIRNQSATYPDRKFYCGFVIGYKDMDTLNSNTLRSDGNYSSEIRNR